MLRSLQVVAVQDMSRGHVDLPEGKQVLYVALPVVPSSRRPHLPPVGTLSFTTAFNGRHTQANGPFIYVISWRRVEHLKRLLIVCAKWP